MKPVAFVDVDDVIADTRFIIEDIIRKEFKVDTRWTEWHSFDLSKSVGISFDPSVFKKHQLIERVKPSQNSSNFLFSLSKTHKVVIVTARGWHQNGYDLTKDWLENNNLFYDKLEVLPLNVSKKTIADEYHSLDLVFDDNADHIEDYLKIDNVSEVFLINRPWNQHLISHDNRFKRVEELPLFKDNKIITEHIKTNSI